MNQNRERLKKVMYGIAKQHPGWGGRGLLVPGSMGDVRPSHKTIQAQRAAEEAGHAHTHL